tara:strand:- start:66 stop:443 length:378 start_codon:yes stop_codon:yes gene_type:complete
MSNIEDRLMDQWRNRKVGLGSKSDTTFVIDPSIGSGLISGIYNESERDFKTKQIAIKKIDPESGTLLDMGGNVWYYDQDALNKDMIKSGEKNILEIDYMFNTIYRGYKPLNEDYGKTEIGPVKEK